jgi:hypothetical protein
VIQIHVHLTGIGMAKSANLQINDDQAFELAMEEEQVDPEPVVIKPQTPLSADKGEVVAEFHQKIS